MKTSKETLLGKYLSRTSLELTAIFLFAFVLICNLCVIRFNNGYFSYFGMPFSEVNYSPQMYDYVNIAIPALLSTGIVIIVFLILARLSDKLAEKIVDKTLKGSAGSLLDRYAQKHPQRIQQISKVIEPIEKSLVLVVCIILMLFSAWEPTSDIGNDKAANTVTFTSISKPADIEQKLIIYKRNDGMIIKTYNTRTEHFENGYIFMSNQDYTGRKINISH